MKDTSFDGFSLIHRLLGSYKDREGKVQELTLAAEAIERLDREIKDLELTILASFDRSPVKVVTLRHDLCTYAVMMIDGRLLVEPSGTPFSLAAPDTVIDPDLSPEEMSTANLTDEQITEAAAHAAVETLRDDERLMDVYDVLRATI